MLIAIAIYKYDFYSSLNNPCLELTYSLSYIYADKTTLVSNLRGHSSELPINNKAIHSLKNIIYKALQEIGKNEIDMFVFEEVWMRVTKKNDTEHLKKKCKSI